jgi:hypothetical protein
MARFILTCVASVQGSDSDQLDPLRGPPLLPFAVVVGNGFCRAVTTTSLPLSGRQEIRLW